MSYPAFKKECDFFLDQQEDMLTHAAVFHTANLLPERPEVYTSAALMELDALLEAVYDPSLPQETYDLMVSSYKGWFDAHYDVDRLRALLKAKTIAQALGFSIQSRINFEMSIAHALGIEDNKDDEEFIG